MRSFQYMAITNLVPYYTVISWDKFDADVGLGVGVDA
jgi:hypothetical protein